MPNHRVIRPISVANKPSNKDIRPVRQGVREQNIGKVRRLGELTLGSIRPLDRQVY